jgi:hypothetical protein
MGRARYCRSDGRTSDIRKESEKTDRDKKDLRHKSTMEGGAVACYFEGINLMNRP